MPVYLNVVERELTSLNEEMQKSDHFSLVTSPIGIDLAAHSSIVTVGVMCQISVWLLPRISDHYNTPTSTAVTLVPSGCLRGPWYRGLQAAGRRGAWPLQFVLVMRRC